MYEVKRMRSATAPTTSPGVMIANINWNRENRVLGIVGASDQGSPEFTPLKKRCVKGLPRNPPIDFPNARLYPTTTQSILTIPAATTLLIMVEITFLR